MGNRRLLGEVVFNSLEELDNSNLIELFSEFSGKKDVDAEIEVTSAFLEAGSNIIISLSTLLYDLCFRVRSLRKYRYENAVSVSFEDKLLFHREDCIDAERQFLIVRFYHAVKNKQSERLAVKVIADANSSNRKDLHDTVIAASCCNYVSDIELTNRNVSLLTAPIVLACFIAAAAAIKLFS